MVAGEVLPKSRARLGWAPPFPNPGPEQRLILQFTMPPALRLSSMTRQDTWKRWTTQDWSAFQQNLLVARNFSPAVVSCPVWSRSGGTEGGAGRLWMQIPNFRVLVFCPPRDGAEQGVQSVDTASGRERKCLWARSRSVSTNQPTNQPLRKLLDAGTLLKKTPLPVRFPHGMSDQRSLGRGGGE